MFCNDIPQLVPQKVCRSCQGCCRFYEASSEWRPKIIGDENVLAGILDSQGYVQTVKEQGENRCTYLNLKSNQCQIYSCRPIECRLYPFLLIKKEDCIKLGVHLSCPYVQEFRYSAGFEGCFQILKQYFLKQEIRNFFKGNAAFLNDYSQYANEIEELAALDV